MEPRYNMDSQAVLDDIIDAKAAAKILGWSLQRVWRMAREGRIPVAKRLGHIFLFSAQDIEKKRGIVI